MDSIVEVNRKAYNASIKKLFNEFVDYKEVLPVLRIAKRLNVNEIVLCAAVKLFISL